MDDGGLGGQALELWAAHRQRLPLMSIFCGFVDMTALACRSDRHERLDMSTERDFVDMCSGSCRLGRHVQTDMSARMDFIDI
jgi:hypothetical protein